MNIDKMRRALVEIDRNQKAQEWLLDHGKKLTGKTDDVEGTVEVSLYAGDEAEGYGEAMRMMESYARISFPALVETCLDNCRNTIVIYREQIREELDSAIIPMLEKRK